MVRLFIGYAALLASAPTPRVTASEIRHYGRETGNRKMGSGYGIPCRRKSPSIAAEIARFRKPRST